MRTGANVRQRHESKWLTNWVHSAQHVDIRRPGSLDRDVRARLPDLRRHPAGGNDSHTSASCAARLCNKGSRGRVRGLLAVPAVTEHILARPDACRNLQAVLKRVFLGAVARSRVGGEAQVGAGVRRHARALGGEVAAGAGTVREVMRRAGAGAVGLARDGWVAHAVVASAVGVVACGPET